MKRRGQMSAAAAIVAIAGLLTPIDDVGAAVFTPSTDLPDGTPTAPAGADPGRHHLRVRIAREQRRRCLRRVRDRCRRHWTSLSRESTRPAPPGHGHRPLAPRRRRDAGGVERRSLGHRPGQRVGRGGRGRRHNGRARGRVRAVPLHAAGCRGRRHGGTGLGAADVVASRQLDDPGLVQVDLVAGATGSEACGTESGSGAEVGPGVMTGNGHCQPLGGVAAEKGKARWPGGRHRQSASC